MERDQRLNTERQAADRENISLLTMKKSGLSASGGS
jgi:hypothetical protein